MKKILLAVIAAAFVASNAWAVWNVLHINEVVFGEAITFFNGSPTDGAVVVNGKIPNQRTAIDMWPVDGILPAEHAITEHVWYRTRFQDWPNFERFSISAMGGAGHYRFNVESGGTGEFKPVHFCFDKFGHSECPFRVLPYNQGVYICEVSGACYNLFDAAKAALKR